MVSGRLGTPGSVRNWGWIVVGSDRQIKICDALEKLVQTRSLSEVKVKDVCLLSGVPRSTFYSYFCDIYSVPQWKWDSMMGNSLYKIGDGLTWGEGHRIMFENILRYKSLFGKIYWENDNNSILEYGYRGGFSAVKQNVAVRKNHRWTEEELNELDYTIWALASLTTKWGREGMVMPVATAVRIFSMHVPLFLKELCDT